MVTESPQPMHCVVVGEETFHRLESVRPLEDDHWPPLAVIDSWCVEFQVLCPKSTHESLRYFVSVIVTLYRGGYTLGRRPPGTATATGTHGLTGPQVRAVVSIIVDCFTRSELRELHYGDMNIHENDLPGTRESLRTYAYELVDYCNRHGRSRELIDKIKGARKHRAHELETILLTAS